MSHDEERERASEPEELSRFFVERANAGYVDGGVALCGPGAVLAFPIPPQVATGHRASSTARGRHVVMRRGREEAGAGY